MGKHKALFWRLFLPLLIWGCLACVILLLPPVPKEPDNLMPEQWSYYGNGAPLARQILKYRTEIVLVIVLCAILSELMFFYLDKRKERKK
jgi:hypothetical protein